MQRTYENTSTMNQILLETCSTAENLTTSCFCVTCRKWRVNDIVNRNTIPDLFSHFTHVLPLRETDRLDLLFRNTIDKVLYGKAYRDACMQQTNYKYFKVWAKNSGLFNNWNEEELTNFCDKVNDANVIYNGWETIVRHLTDSRIDLLDVRRLSLNELRLAKGKAWCFSRNEAMRGRSNKRKRTVTGNCYSEHKYNSILNELFQSDILNDIKFDPQATAALGRRLQNDLVTYSLNQRHREMTLNLTFN